MRVLEYTVPDRDGNGTGELIALITTITDQHDATAEALAQAYHQRWEHETGNKQLKTHLRGHRALPAQLFAVRSGGVPGRLRATQSSTMC